MFDPSTEPHFNIERLRWASSLLFEILHRQCVDRLSLCDLDDFQLASVPRLLDGLRAIQGLHHLPNLGDRSARSKVAQPYLHGSVHPAWKGERIPLLEYVVYATSAALTHGNYDELLEASRGSPSARRRAVKTITRILERFDWSMAILESPPAPAQTEDFSRI